MNKFFGRLSAALISLMVMGGAAVAAAEKQQFERPSFSQGDYWVYSSPNGEERLEYVGEEEGYHVFMRKGAKQLRDADLNVKGDAYTYFQFPLYVGKYWSYDLSVKTPTTQSTVRAACEVKGMEPVETAAGIFQALTITCDETYIHVGGGKPRRTYSYWYAPEVKQMVKNTSNKILKEYKITK